VQVLSSTNSSLLSRTHSLKNAAYLLVLTPGAASARCRSFLVLILVYFLELILRAAYLLVLTPGAANLFSTECVLYRMCSL
jgi:hypothetical protein